MSDDSSIVLSFHDSLIRKSDVQLLNERCWLNDALIAFVFEYFEREQYKAFADQVAFISPEVTQFIKFAADEEVGIFLNPLNLETKRYIFLAVNDNSSVAEAGGSHWSLLLYCGDDKGFSHYDSYGGCNLEAATDVARKLHCFLKGAPGLQFETKICPQQTNVSDCGVYVVCFVEQLCEQLLRNLSSTMEDSITPDSVSQKRRELKQLIYELAKGNKS